MKRLTKLRQSLELSKWDLARRAGVHPNRVGAIENGRIVPGDDSVELVRLAKALGWSGDPAKLLQEAGDGAEH